MPIQMPHHVLTNSRRATCAILFVAIGLFLFLPDTAFAQLQWNKQTENFPYELYSTKEIVLMTAGTGLLYAGGRVQNNLQPLDEAGLHRLNPETLRWPDRLATDNWNPSLNNIREILEPASIIGTLGLIGSLGLHQRISNYSWTPLKTLTLMYLEGAYMMEGTVLLTKALIQRPRPYTYNTSLDLAQRLSSANNESFLSGNAGVLFYHATFASLVIRDLYPEKPWLPYLFAATHGLAALSSYWSVRSGMHFPSDVLAGALWGSGVAILVTQLHKTKARQLKLTPWALQLGKGNLKSSHEAYGLRLEAETRLKVFGLSLEYCF